MMETMNHHNTQRTRRTARQPVFKFYPRQFFVETYGMPLTQVGMYSHLIVLRHAKGDEALDDQQAVKRHLGIRTAKEAALLAETLPLVRQSIL